MNPFDTIYESEIEYISDDAILYVSSDDSSNDESDYFDINNGDSDDNSNIPITFESELTDIISNMTNSNGDKLLKLLKKNGHPTLPMTARTFLNNNTKIQILSKSRCLYYFFGVKNMLLSYFKKYNYNKDIIHIMLNIDGLPLFSNSAKSVWPILVKLVELDCVFPVAITYGKP